MPPPPLKPPLSLEGLDRRLRVLEDDKEERDLNERQTADRQSHEITQAIEAAVAHVASPRFGRVDADNAELLAAARRSEQERLRRITAEIQLKSLQELEEKALAKMREDRRHTLKWVGVLTVFLTPVLALIIAAIASHCGLPTPPPPTHEEHH